MVIFDIKWKLYIVRFYIVSSFKRSLKNLLRSSIIRNLSPEHYDWCDIIPGEIDRKLRIFTRNRLTITTSLISEIEKREYKNMHSGCAQRNVLQNKKELCKMTSTSNVNVTVAHRYSVRQAKIRKNKIRKKERKRITLDMKIMIPFLFHEWREEFFVEVLRRLI